MLLLMEKNFLINLSEETQQNIRKNATGQVDDYATDFLLDQPYFEENYKLINVNPCKQEAKSNTKN